MIGAANHAEESALTESESLEHFGPFGGIFDGGGFGLQLNAHADDLDVVARIVEFGGDPCLDTRDGVEFVLSHVGNDEDSSIREKEMRLENFALIGGESGSVERSAFRQRRLRLLESFDLREQVSVEFRLTLRLGQTLLDRFEIGECEFDLDDAQVLEGVGGSRNVVVDEGTKHEHDGVDLTDVGEEFVAEAFTLARALDESSDVDHLHRGVHHVLAGRHGGQAVEPIVGHLGHADVGVLGREGVGGGQSAATGESVVQRALPGVGKADESESFHEVVETIPLPEDGSGSHIVNVILLPLLASIVPVTPPSIESIPAGDSCASYSIEGSLDATSVTSSGANPDPNPSEAPGRLMSGDLEISATAYLHDGDQPLAGHRVLAVFDMAQGAEPVDPLEIVTDVDGRASVVLPVGAIGVSFRAESAAVGECPDVAPGDVPVVIVDLPVIGPGLEGPASSEPLPVTGREADVAAIALAVVALGLGTLVLGRRTPTEEQGGWAR